jgi:hypothetical protein
MSSTARVEAPELRFPRSPSMDDRHRADGVMDDLLADGAEQEARESTTAAVPDHD